MFPYRNERDFAAEIESHIEIETDRLIAEGMDPAEACQAARRRFGNLTTATERFYESTRWMWLEQLLQDLRYGLRTLRQAPAFALVAVFSLALGIGANTACFSLLDALLLKSLPVQAPEELRVVLWKDIPDVSKRSQSSYGITDPRTGEDVRGSFSYPAYVLFRDHIPQFSHLIAFSPNQFTTTVRGFSDFSSGLFVSGNYFSGLGVQPLLGRPILPEDDQAGKPAVTVITRGFWQRRFGLDPAALGARILVDNRPTTIIGILGPGFQGLDPGARMDLFIPITKVHETGAQYYRLTRADNWWVNVYGRLRPGSAEGAAIEAANILLKSSVETYAGRNAVVPPVRLLDGSKGIAQLRLRYSHSVLVLAAIVGLVLLVACANLANLLLARAATRGREFAIRLSIGAGRGRLVRQLLTESLLLAGTGAMIGVLLAAPLRNLIVSAITGSNHVSLDARTDLRTLLFTFGIGILTALLFGAAPAWRATRIDLTPSLRGTGFAGRSQMRLGKVLIATQVALSLLLLVGAALFIRTLSSLYSRDFGMRTDHLLTFQTDPSRNGYKDEKLAALYQRLQDRLSAIPGVEFVGLSNNPLLRGWSSNEVITVAGIPSKSGAYTSTYFLHCSDTFIPALGLTLRLGRALAPTDAATAPAVAVVNETFVRKYLNGQNPIGHIFYRDESPGPDTKPIQIVGVVKDAYYDNVRHRLPPTVYYPYAQWSEYLYGMTFSIRSPLPASSLGPAVRRAVAEVDPLVPVAEMATQDEVIAESLGTERLFAGLVSSFGVLAAFLAAIGLYGILAYAVARRTAEIGIRLALGATHGNVQWLVVRESVVMVLAGILVGVPTALALSKFVEKLLFGVKPTDPLSIAVAVAFMIAIAGAAAWIPARRASRVDPNVALRCD